jgi:hypothetical protein
MPEILKKIGEIDVLRNPRNPDDSNEGSIKLDIARNGMFYLVANAGKDAYGNPKCEVFDTVDSTEFRSIHGFCDGLVQVIGSLIIERDSLASQLASAVRTKE